MLEFLAPEIVLIAATFVGLAFTSLAIARDVRGIRNVRAYQL
ncbi:MAG TPA: hypothetical protein VFC31_04190 [Candidatus Limnocylindria bacterium]|nr:hypothetical protein [Candidatus Limnocylindria bacterium]